MIASPPYALVYARAERARLLSTVLPPPYVSVTSRSELITAMAARRPDIAYVDVEFLGELDTVWDHTTVVAIVEGALDAIVHTLVSYPRLTHVITTAMLGTPQAGFQLAGFQARVMRGPEHPVLGPTGIGRVVLLTSSSHREARLDRIREFYASHDISERTAHILTDIVEELLTNALYDAPVDAGYFKAAISRANSVDLPSKHACEVSYGVDGKNAFVRIRDPFGALTRSRLLVVLARCNRQNVELDESRGGAGLGLWRVFSTASRICITVMPGRLTDFVVWVDARARTGPKHLLAVHLFMPGAHEVDGVQSWFASDHDDDLVDESFTALVSGLP